MRAFPENAKAEMVNHAHRYTSPGTEQGPRGSPFLSIFTSDCTFCELHVIHGICMGERSVVSPKNTGYTINPRTEENMMKISDWRNWSCMLSACNLFK